MNMIDNELINKRINNLTILGFDFKKYKIDEIRKQNREIKHVQKYVVCKCDCGVTKSICLSHVIRGKTKTCGHKKEYSPNNRFELSIGEYLCDLHDNEWLANHWGNNSYSPFELGCGVDKVKVEMICDHGHRYYVTPQAIKKNSLCHICYNKKVVSGVNDIATTHPNLAKYFANIEDTHKYSHGSGKYVEMICPTCKAKRFYMINKLNRFGFLPCSCNDGICYPNKFITSILTQLDIKFKTEKVFCWGKDKRYDHYIPLLSCVIEAHGGQHYGDGFSTLGGRTLEDEQANDKLKREIALNNGIKHYIELDCRKSDMEWIKNSVMVSELPAILNFKEEDIDWLECERFAISNIIGVVCTLWGECMDVSKIAQDCGLAKITIIRHLKIGKTIGLCDYDPDAQKQRAISTFVQKNINNSRPVEVFYDGKSLGIFRSGKYLSSISLIVFGLEFKYSNIIAVTSGRRKRYKGYVFKYASLDEKGNKIIEGDN